MSDKTKGIIIGALGAVVVIAVIIGIGGISGIISIKVASIEPVNHAMNVGWVDRVPVERVLDRVPVERVVNRVPVERVVNRVPVERVGVNTGEVQEQNEVTVAAV